jgi:hypothetical protein
MVYIKLAILSLLTILHVVFTEDLEMIEFKVDNKIFEVSHQARISKLDKPVTLSLHSKSLADCANECYKNLLSCVLFEFEENEEVDNCRIYKDSDYILEPAENFHIGIFKQLTSDPVQQ